MDTNLYQIANKALLKSIDQRTYSAVERFGEIETKSLINICIFSLRYESYYLEFLPDGRTIKNVVYKETGEIEESCIKVYNGERLKETHDNDYRHNATQSHYVYSADGQLKEIMIHGHENNVVKKIILKYDKEGKVSEENSYDSSGVFIEKKVYKRNMDGQVHTKTRYGRSGEELDEVYFHYKNGRLSFLSHIDIRGGEESAANCNSYDDFERLVEYSRTGGKFVDNYKYDDNGLLTMQRKQSYNKRDDVIAFKYNFDDRGNWTDRIFFRNEIPFAKSIRKMEYYEEV